jgi:hypothetical protein
VTVFIICRDQLTGTRIALRTEESAFDCAGILYIYSSASIFRVEEEFFSSPPRPLPD